jgi:hypothetical protein
VRVVISILLLTLAALSAQAGPYQAAECHRDGDVITIQGTATAQSLELANGSVRNVWLLVTDKPICIVASEDGVEKPHEISVSRVQIIGEPPPLAVSIELTGKLSTGNITQYYAAPTAIQVQSDRRIATTPTTVPPQSLVPKNFDTSAVPGILLLLGVALVYFFPTLVARASHHHNVGAIFVLNLFLGWTFLGWVIALVWAFMKPVR